MYRTMAMSLMLLAVAMFGLMSQPASASILVSEDFDYASGTYLIGQSGGTGFTSAYVQNVPLGGATTGWQAWTGTTTNPTMTKAGYVGGGGGNFAHTNTSLYLDRSIPTNEAPTMYAAFLYRCNTQGARETAVGLLSTGQFAGCIQVDNVNYKWNVYSPSLWYRDTGVTIVRYAINLVVLRVDWDVGEKGNDRIRVYINPNLAAGEAANTPIFDDASADSGGVGMLNAIRLSGDRTNSDLDGFRLATTWEDLAVPEPYTLALLAAGLVGLLVYGWRKRR